MQEAGGSQKCRAGISFVEHKSHIFKDSNKPSLNQKSSFLENLNPGFGSEPHSNFIRPKLKKT